jgi:hypothetical protein
MAAVLHLYKGGDPGLARAAIEHALAAGDQVSVALLHGAALSMLPGAVRVHRVPDELGWDALLETIFASDQVVTW